MTINIFDIEIYRNYFCVVFRDVETKEFRSFQWALFPKEVTMNDVSKMSYVPYDIDDREELKNFLSTDNIYVGYNSISFDIPVLEKVFSCNSILELWQYAQERIHNSKPWNLPFCNLFTIDLMTLAFNEEPKSLKLVGTNLNYPKLQELPIHYTKTIDEDDADKLLKYCHNDVLVTEYVYDFLSPAIAMRADIGERYMNDWSYFLSDADSVMGDKLMKMMWESSGNTIPSKDEIPDAEPVCFGDIIMDNVRFNSAYLNQILEQTKTITVTQETSFSINIELAQITHNLAKGGIHGSPKNLIICENEEYMIIDADVRLQQRLKAVYFTAEKLR